MDEEDVFLLIEADSRYVTKRSSYHIFNVLPYRVSVGNDIVKMRECYVSHLYIQRDHLYIQRDHLLEHYLSGHE
jgi:hypothetical protein